MIVLIEASDTSDTKAEELWDILSAAYECNPDLYDLPDDRRKLHAAELIVSALKARRIRFGDTFLENLTPFDKLTRKLAAYRANGGQTEESVANAEGVSAQQSMYEIVDNAGFDLDMDNAGFDFDMDFHDIDWSFWSSID
jgi:hypothetical protein